MSTWFFLCLLVVVNSAIWVFFDASRLRDSRHAGVGPLGTPPQTWAAMVFLVWPIAFPYYLSKRPLSEDLEERSGPPPRFVTEGLTAFAMLVGLLGFGIFGGLLAMGELQMSIIGLVVAAAGIFGGRKTHMTREHDKVELGSLAIEQIGFAAPAADEHIGDESEAPANLDQYFASMRRASSEGPSAPPLISSAPGNRAPEPPRPVNSPPDGPPPGVPYAPSLGSAPQPAAPQPAVPQPAVPQPAAPQPAAPQPAAPPPAAPQPQLPSGVPYEPPPPGQPYIPPLVQAPPAYTPPAQEPGVPAAKPPEDPQATVALSPSALQRQMNGVDRGTAPEGSLPAPPVSSSPSVFVPPDPPPKSSQDVPRPPAAVQRRLPRPPAATPNRRTSGTAQPVGSYAFAAKESPFSRGLKFLAAAFGVVAVAGLGWLAWNQWMPSTETSPSADTADLDPPDEEKGSARKTAKANPSPKIKNRREGGTLPPEKPPEIAESSGSTTQDVVVTPEQIKPWTEEYIQWMAPLALQLDEIDFEGIDQSRCRDLQKHLRSVESNIPECPDSEVENLLGLALPILHSSADACRGDNEERWASSLLEAKKLIHKAQVLLDERYRFAGISELELESAIGVQRSPSSISGRWLIEMEEKGVGQTFVDEDLEGLLGQDDFGDDFGNEDLGDEDLGDEDLGDEDFEEEFPEDSDALDEDALDEEEGFGKP